jgi:hypothetical protein
MNTHGQPYQKHILSTFHLIFLKITDYILEQELTTADMRERHLSTQNMEEN